MFLLAFQAIVIKSVCVYIYMLLIYMLLVHILNAYSSPSETVLDLSEFLKFSDQLLPLFKNQPECSFLLIPYIM